MPSFKLFMDRVARDEDGAVVVEYIFLIIFIAIVALGAIRTFGGAVNNKMGNNNNSVVNAFGP